MEYFGDIDNNGIWGQDDFGNQEEVYKAPTIVNLDKAKSLKDILSAYKTLAIDRKADEVLYHGDIVGISEVIDIDPPYTLNDEVLPNELESLETDTGLDEVVLTFSAKVDFDAIKSHFAPKGFSGTEHGEMLYLLNSNNQIIARYTQNQVAISSEFLGQYISNMGGEVK